MVKVRLLSRHMTGWIAEFSGEDVKKIREYCLKEDEEIRYFLVAPTKRNLSKKRSTRILICILIMGLLIQWNILIPH